MEEKADEGKDVESEVNNITELEIAIDKAVTLGESVLKEVKEEKLNTTISNEPIKEDNVWVNMIDHEKEHDKDIIPKNDHTYKPVNLGIEVQTESDDTGHDEWHATDETLTIIMQSAIRYHLAYKKEYTSSNGIRAQYGVYIILGSGINSIFIAGGNNFISPYIITILTCMLSLVTGLIQSLKTFFKVDEKVDSCLIASKDLFKLYCDIHFMLGTPHQYRKVDADKYLTDITGRYVQILDNAVSLSNGKDNPIFDIVLREKLRSNLGSVSP